MSKKINSIYSGVATPEFSCCGKKLACILLFLCCILPAGAQTYNDVYKKIGDLYLDARTFQVNITVDITYLPGYEAGNQVYTGQVIKNDKKIYTRFADKINIMAEGKNIFIDNNSHIIMISKSSYDEKEIKKTLFSGFEEEGYLKKYDFHLLKTSKEKTIFEILPKNAEDVYKRIELTVNTADYSLYQVVYEMNPIEGNTVANIHIRYSATELNAAIPEDFFDLKKYIMPAGQTYQGVGSYAGFKIINQIK